MSDHQPAEDAVLSSDDTEPAPKKKKGWLRRLFGGGEEGSQTSADTDQDQAEREHVEGAGDEETTTAAEEAVAADGAVSASGDEPSSEPVSESASASDDAAVDDEIAPSAIETPTPAPLSEDSTEEISPEPETPVDGVEAGSASPQDGPDATAEDAQTAGEKFGEDTEGSEDTKDTENTGASGASKTDDASTVEKKSWFQRLKEGLARSSSRLSTGITDLFTKRKLDDEALEDLEDLLIQADLGVKTAGTLTQALAKGRFGKDISPEEVRTALADEAARLLEPVARPLVIDRSHKPHVILTVGVNGAGKTTTIGKMARQFRDQGLSVSLAAGDTFRAAAVEQLKVWGDRTGCPVISRDTGADAAGLAYDALKESAARGDDILMIDTAGRLHNKAALMDELSKIRRVIQKLDPTAPHTTLLVLDATVGQNAHQQVKVFGEMVDVTGLVMTKLDGTAKGGVVVALAQEFALPVHYLGVGETVDDLRPFEAHDFARSLMGLS